MPKIHYNGNGSTSGMAPADPASYQVGQMATVLGNGSLGLAGAEFTLWNTAPDSSGQTYLPGEALTFTSSADVTLYARWGVPYGTTSNFDILYDTTLSANGPALAQVVVDYGDDAIDRLNVLFGQVLTAANLPIRLVLTPPDQIHKGGAMNDGVRHIWWYCDTTYSATGTAGRPGIVVAELAEIYMVAQNKGWVLNWSNGEALSRVIPGLLYPENAWLACVGNNWLNGIPGSPNAARSNWVDQTYPSDVEGVSYGCGTLFLNYLANQLKYTWPAIIGAGAPATRTLAETAQQLGVPNAWQGFINLINQQLPQGTSLPAQPTSFGQQPQPTDNPYPLPSPSGAVPALYIRHNLADDGTSHTGSLSDSPDIIVKNIAVSDPQSLYSTPASIASDTQSDPDVLTGQTNYVYTRVWNRGADATNVFATVYWSPPATLVTPDKWKLAGSAYYPHVPAGSMVEVSAPGISWPADQLPGAGHFCFVATVGNSDAPPPVPQDFATFDAYVDYIYQHNNITWRNFNVVVPPPHMHRPPRWIHLPFHITGAWDRPRVFALETHADLPEGSHLALHLPHWLGQGLKPAHPDFEESEEDRDAEGRRHLRLPLHAQRVKHLGEVELPGGTAASSRMTLHIPAEAHLREHKLVVRQLYRGREVGRITWLILPPARHRHGEHA
jgi:hypothetical protein